MVGHWQADSLGADAAQLFRQAISFVADCKCRGSFAREIRPKTSCFRGKANGLNLMDLDPMSEWFERRPNELKMENASHAGADDRWVKWIALRTNEDDSSRLAGHRGPQDGS